MARPRADRGFTLLELLVVLVLLGIMATVAVPAMGRFLDSLAFKKQTAKVMAAVRYARLRAVTSGREVRLRLGEDELSLDLSGGVEEHRALDLEDRDAALQLEPEVIIFSPQGFATPGAITLRVGERTETVEVDPMSGLPQLLLEDEEP